MEKFKEFIKNYWRCVLAVVIGIGSPILFWGSWTRIAVLEVAACLLILDCRIAKLEEKILPKDEK